MKKGNSINETLILLQQDIREFYNVMPHELHQKRQMSENASKARSAFCFIAFGISKNIFNVGVIEECLNVTNQAIYQFIQQGQNLSDLKELKSHLKKQGWKI